MPPAQTLLSAHIRHRRREPRLLTEHEKQTVFPHAPHAWSPAPDSPPSTSIIVASSSPPSPAPQSSHSLPRCAAGSGTVGAEMAGDDAAGPAPGRFQKECSEGCAVGGVGSCSCAGGECSCGEGCPARWVCAV
jgi:hypothetical protein